MVRSAERIHENVLAGIDFSLGRLGPRPSRHRENRIHLRAASITMTTHTHDRLTPRGIALGHL
eukprot:scaffold8394_cov30-Phaeocystis_antarctica.AAC.1